MIRDTKYIIWLAMLGITCCSCKNDNNKPAEHIALKDLQKDTTTILTDTLFDYQQAPVFVHKPVNR